MATTCIHGVPAYVPCDLCTRDIATGAATTESVEIADLKTQRKQLKKIIEGDTEIIARQAMKIKMSW